jgi:hypothetical protein
MQRRAAWTEANPLGIILSAYIAHKLAHAVSMVVGRLESMLCDQPPWREYHEVHGCSAEYLYPYPSIADLQVRTVKMEGSG